MKIKVIGEPKEGKTTVATLIKFILEEQGATVTVNDLGDDFPKLILPDSKPLYFKEIVVNVELQGKEENMADIVDYGEIQTIKTILEQEKHNLDLFNLEVAKFRLEYGMSKELIQLYECMGNLCRKLLALNSKVQGVENSWCDIVYLFQLMRDKEGVNA